MDDGLVQGDRRMEAGADRTVRVAPASARAGNAFGIGLQPGGNDYNSVHVRRQIEQRMGRLDLERSGTTADQQATAEQMDNEDYIRNLMAITGAGQGLDDDQSQYNIFKRNLTHASVASGVTS